MSQPEERREPSAQEPEVGAGPRAPWRVCKGCGEPFDHGRVQNFCEPCIRKATVVLRDVTKSGSDLGRDQLALTVLLAVDGLAPAPEREPLPSESFGHMDDPAYQRGEITAPDVGERFVEMACCGFRFSAVHEDTDRKGWSCPTCAPRDSDAVRAALTTLLGAVRKQREVLDTVVVANDGAGECEWCGAETCRNVAHEPKCPVTTMWAVDKALRAAEQAARQNLEVK